MKLDLLKGRNRDASKSNNEEFEKLKEVLDSDYWCGARELQAAASFYGLYITEFYHKNEPRRTAYEPSRPNKTVL